MTSLTPSAASPRISAARRVSPWRTSAAFVGRSLRHTVRDGESLVMAIMLPVMLMLLFTYVFGGAIARDGSYINYVVPGVLVLSVSQGSATTAGAVARDMTNGVMNRFRTMPIFGATALVGHVIAGTVRNAVAACVVLMVATLIGFRPTIEPLALVTFAGLLLLFVVAITAVMTMIGMLSGSPESAAGYGVLFFILPYVSSGFAPLETMPEWLRSFAQHQPYTPIIESIRASLMGEAAPASAPLAVAWCVALIAVAALVSALIFPRKIARPVG